MLTFPAVIRTTVVTAKGKIREVAPNFLSLDDMKYLLK